MLCPSCGASLPHTPTAVSYKPSVRIERYWCGTCRNFKKGVAERDFDAEDEGLERSWGPVLWDLGSFSSEHPFSEAA